MTSICWKIITHNRINWIVSIIIFNIIKLNNAINFRYIKITIFQINSVWHIKSRCNCYHFIYFVIFVNIYQGINISGTSCSNK